MGTVQDVRRGRGEHGGVVRWLLVLVGLAALLFGLYVTGALWWSYSEGERAGYVQKLSRKGFICKTWEGELAMTTVPGTAPTLWQFTVRDPEAVKKLQDTIGRRVALHYTEHLGVPTSCFGDTRYYVDRVRVLDEP